MRMMPHGDTWVPTYNSLAVSALALSLTRGDDGLGEHGQVEYHQ